DQVSSYVKSNLRPGFTQTPKLLPAGEGTRKRAEKIILATKATLGAKYTGTEPLRQQDIDNEVWSVKGNLSKAVLDGLNLGADPNSKARQFTAVNFKEASLKQKDKDAPKTKLTGSDF